MSNHFTDIFSFTTDKAQLEHMAEKYPWCSVVQLALLQQYKKNNSIQFQKQATKSGLYFNNIHWVNWQLHRLSKEEEAREIEKEEEANEMKNDEVTETVSISEEQKPQIESSLPGTSPVASETSIEFEPLHTTDYFASQGIKLTDAPITNDKLGSQVKSFTEWLKSMKKVHKEKLGAGDEQTDKTIQLIAERSNADAEVITEAMADVLIGQHKTEKAIEVYEKLSLINPSKSAYFAAKIESLSTGRQI